VDLTKAIDTNKKILITGIRPGEKIHEEMITTSDALNTYEFKSYYIIIPNSEFISGKKHNEFKKFIKKNKAQKVMKNFCYNSLNNNHFLSVKELQNLIFKIIK
jgi:FlaA1/EpsC-like NDP-sugar epimerase